MQLTRSLGGANLEAYHCQHVYFVKDMGVHVNWARLPGMTVVLPVLVQPLALRVTRAQSLFSTVER